jgi:tetratricopeptide (TPR) repeat protein
MECVITNDMARKHTALIIGLAFIITLPYILSGLGIIKSSTFWAFSVNAYLPRWLFIIHVLLVIISLTSFFLPRLVKCVIKIPTTIQYVIFGVLLVAGAILLREKIPLYGDGYFFQRTIETQIIKFTQVFSIILYRAVSHLLPESTYRGAHVYRLVNTVLVLPATGVFLFFARRLPRKHVPFFLLMILSLGANVLFFGHIENYTLCFVSVLFYLYCITLKKPNTVLISLMLGISMSLHVIAVCLVPSCVYAVVKYRDKMSNITAIGRMFVLLLMPLIATVLLGLLIGITPQTIIENVIISIGETKGHNVLGFFTSMITWSHWMDIINLFFLSMPALPILLYLLMKMQKQTNKAHVDFRLLWLMALPFVIFLMVFSSPLGLARDWDLGLTAMAWVVIALYFYSRGNEKKQYLSSAVLFSLALLSFSLQMPWFFLHRYPDRAVERYKDILEARPEFQATAYGYEILGRYYHDAGKFQESLDAYKAATVHDPDNYRHYRNIAMECLNIGNIKGAIENLQRAYALNPQKVTILVDLAKIYHDIGADTTALKTLQKAYSIDSVSVSSLYNLGCAYYWNAQYDTALYLFKRILETNPRHYHTLMALTDVAIALEYFQHATETLDAVVSYHGINDAVNQRRALIRQMMVE